MTKHTLGTGHLRHLSIFSLAVLWACGGTAAEETLSEVASSQDSLITLADRTIDFEADTDESPGFGIPDFLQEFGEWSDTDDDRFPERDLDALFDELEDPAGERTPPERPDSNGTEPRDENRRPDETNTRGETDRSTDPNRDPNRDPNTRPTPPEREPPERVPPEREPPQTDRPCHHDCMQGHLRGRWINLPNRDGGVFGGRWVSRNHRFLGYAFGRWGHRNGRNFFVGKIIRRDGRFLGRLAGTWAPHARPQPEPPETDRPNGTRPDGTRDPNEAGDPGTRPDRPEPADPTTRPAPEPRTDGMFRGVWHLRNGRHGEMRGEYAAGPRPGTGHYFGGWGEICEPHRPDPHAPAGGN